jgi:hypothetical protein
MGDFKINEKSVITQSGSAEPVLASNVNLGSATFPAGHVIQVKSFTKTDTASTTHDESAAPVTTGLTVTLNNNLSSASNKVLIFINVGGIGQQYGTGATFLILDGVTSTATGDAATGEEVTMAVNSRGSDGYNIKSASMCFEDSPATVTPQAYTLMFHGSGGTNYINRAYSVDANSGNTISTITAMEIQV